MRVDCDTCAVRGPACGDCVVSFLTIPVRPAAGPTPASGAILPVAAAPGDVRARRGPLGHPPVGDLPPEERPIDYVLADRPVEDGSLLDEAEQQAVAVLAAYGLVPPLRMVAGA